MYFMLFRVGVDGKMVISGTRMHTITCVCHNDQKLYERRGKDTNILLKLLII